MALPTATSTPLAISATPISSTGQGPGIEHDDIAISAGAGTMSSGPFSGSGTNNKRPGGLSQGGGVGVTVGALSGQGQLAQLLQQQQQQQAHQSFHHGSTGNSAASLSSTIAASGLVLLPPPPLTFKNLTIHTSLLSTKQQLLQQQQQLQQLHHAQLNNALKKQQQQQQKQQPHSSQPGLSMEDCSPSALSEETVEGGERDGSKGYTGAGNDSIAAISPSQSASLSTTRVTSPIPGTLSASGFHSGKYFYGRDKHCRCLYVTVIEEQRPDFQAPTSRDEAVTYTLLLGALLFSRFVIISGCSATYPFSSQ
ncbi:hypothetical protein FBU30_008865 [Linnemannia zychae]|nr:hypothetical protein FBU30_008865 [Linnemannia zychae]